MNDKPLVILLVEDNPDHAELILRSLRVQGIGNSIYMVSDGEVALDYLHQRGAYADPETSPRPQLILLDLRLPRIDGLEVLGEIKACKTLRSIPVVILTSSEAEKDIVRAYHHHANSYLVKPMDFLQFSQMMNNLSFYWLCLNRRPYSDEPPSPEPSWNDSWRSP